MISTEAITPKKKLLDTAARLFFQRGYRAVGVDTIAAEAGIGKMTLYRHFPSKDALIVAYLRESDRDFWQYFETSTAQTASPREKILAFFGALEEYVTSPACYGCPFINLASEYPQADYPGHQIAIEHKRSVLARFLLLAQEAGASHPEELAGALLLLMDGAYMAARMYGASPENPAAGMRQSALRLLEAHGASPAHNG